MFLILDSITILVFYVLRLTNVNVFKTELTYAATLCPYREVVLSIYFSFVYVVVNFYFSQFLFLHCFWVWLYVC